MSSEPATDFTYELEPDEPVTDGVIEAVSEVYDLEPTSLEPLYSVLDPDALDALFKPGDSSNLTVEFRYNGCEVQVTSDRNIVIRTNVNGG